MQSSHEAVLVEISPSITFAFFKAPKRKTRVFCKFSRRPGIDQDAAPAPRRPVTFPYLSSVLIYVAFEPARSFFRLPPVDYHGKMSSASIRVVEFSGRIMTGLSSGSEGNSPRLLGRGIALVSPGMGFINRLDISRDLLTYGAGRVALAILNKNWSFRADHSANSIRFRGTLQFSSLSAPLIRKRHFK